ncbi:hypothetical protein CAPTEDRAFT_181793 [Capitella teleta]|uniref:Mannosyl-oligosaccharide glucosidase n=1 Tax=Capitella teleta TaxID=283909 RepID=R7T654_CAPTE|nr:hypothetical protein CAPTEDRAFT_181793 [Capitella teleta]|eukprot:ELT88875.1 hypothetical protein CAPTEDRAFT_181793 [Capitella teleta]
MDRSSKIILVLFPVAIICGILYVHHHAQLRDRIKTPLDAPKIIDPLATSAAMDPHRFWGSYRSGLYFGLKTRSPQSPVVGLMWMQQFGEEMPPPLRHWCDQGDRLPMYGWVAHDGANFGLHEILDQFYTVSTDFVKHPGGSHGGDWSARIRVNPRVQNAIISLYFYMALDGSGYVSQDIKASRLQSISGNSVDLGNFELKFPKSEKKGVKYDYLVTHAPSLAVLKETVGRNLVLKQWDNSKSIQYIALAGHRLPQNIEDPNFIKFENTFHLKQKGFDAEHFGFAQAMLSNMLGGIGYFYGSSKVQSPYNKEPIEYWPAALYTAVPSRSSFPRGFLWDEGFHNLLIFKWDQEFSMDIIGHWLDLMNTEGWIPREQILGDDSRARVPDEFIVQHNSNANPPTLFLPLQTIVKRLIKSTDPKHRVYLENLFPRLKAWYKWFNTTQQGPLPLSYRWKGRNADAIKEINPKTLTSGLDDYPRASHPTDQERHLDLRCWMALASNVMMDIAQTLGQPYAEYEATYNLLTDNDLLDTLHWSERTQRYSDFGLHTDAVKLERPKVKNLQPGQRPPQLDKQRVVKKDPKYQFVDSTFGYVSLFPFLLRILQPESLKLGRVLTDLQDPSLLWTQFGLRSLAKTSPLYKKHNSEHDPPYWRGSIWININYLAVKALHHYAEEIGPYQNRARSIYQELRTNIINNIYKQYRSTGFIWENYDDVTGKGQGVHPFTGWSALVVAIMAEEY